MQNSFAETIFSWFHVKAHVCYCLGCVKVPHYDCKVICVQEDFHIVIWRWWETVRYQGELDKQWLLGNATVESEDFGAEAFESDYYQPAIKLAQF